ncbi:unnamed protein product [Staurois parvus]|uniref:Uncharacterized protein n=1 Tax=Staurois parvus TaxID=386267 RepID=A0ABN9GXT9_9NEOB|nr:unnamed protein product [Staurois parvus]
MFKGFDKMKHINSVYTSSQSSMCGIELDFLNQVEYLLSGYLQGNKATINLCGLSIRWEGCVSIPNKGTQRLI